MIALSMESIFLILSGVILLAGILYWFWSHIQLTQKKVQLLENAIYELRDMVTTGPGSSGISSSSSSSSSVSSPSSKSASPVYNDLADDDWEESADVKVIQTEVPAVSSFAATGSEDDNTFTIGREEEISADVEIPSAQFEAANEGDYVSVQRVEYAPDNDVTIHDVVYESAATVPETKDFRDIFITTGGDDNVSVATASQQSIDSMPVKELRRLAEQRGIEGVHDMRKKELLAALRAAVSPQQGTTTVTIEKYLNVDVTEETTAAVDTEILE